MDRIGVAVATAGVIGMATVIIKRIKLCFERHQRNTKQLDELPKIIEKHKKEHKCINEQLRYSARVDVVQLRNQLLSIHEKAIESGSISVHWKTQFYDLYDKYKEGGGNGLVERLKTDIDNL